MTWKSKKYLPLLGCQSERADMEVNEKARYHVHWGQLLSCVQLKGPAELSSRMNFLDIENPKSVIRRRVSTMLKSFLTRHWLLGWHLKTLGLERSWFFEEKKETLIHLLRTAKLYRNLYQVFAMELGKARLRSVRVTWVSVQLYKTVLLASAS